MNVIWHDDKRMQFVVALAAVLLQGIQKQFSICRNLKQTAAIEGCAAHKVGSRPNRTRGDRHWKIVEGTRTKGTASAVPHRVR